MVFLRVYHTYELDIVEIPNEIEKDIYEYCHRCREWYQEEPTTQEFVDFLNDFIESDGLQRAKIIAEDVHPTEEEKDKIKFYKKIWF